jgi:hypothetical protein
MCLSVIMGGQGLRLRSTQHSTKLTNAAKAAILPKRYHLRSLAARSRRADIARKRRCKSRNLCSGPPVSGILEDIPRVAPSPPLPCKRGREQTESNAR